MNTKLNFRTYKYKDAGIDVILFRPDDKKYGLFQQDKNDNFTIDVLHKYYNLPPYNKGKFDVLYEDYTNQNQILEFSIKNIIKSVKKKLKHFNGEILTINKTDNKYDIATLDVPSSETASRILKKKFKKAFNLHSLSKEELNILLAYLWPHKGENENSKELNINSITKELENKSQIRIYVDRKPLYYLMSGISL